MKGDPHVRGDGKRPRSSNDVNFTSFAPRARGRQASSPARLAEMGVRSTRAGTARAPHLTGVALNRSPHVCGDGKHRLARRFLIWAFAPRACRWQV